MRAHRDNDKRVDSAILGVAMITLGLLYDAPPNVIGLFLRGWFVLMGVCMVLRAFTKHARPRLDRTLGWMMIVLSVVGMILAVTSRVLAVGG